MQPRFQVFLSSTFRDLREERQSALEAILELGHFPAGMEAFPAADATPWELIKTIIADSDYYVLIVGGRYGSTGPEGISYTELEYNLAEELGKPILAFVHGEPDQIPAGKTELEPKARKMLQKFRERVTKRICKEWTSKQELKSGVILSLVHAILTRPAFGWIRNEGLENQELLKRLTLLQERFDAKEAELKALQSELFAQGEMKKFLGLDSSIELSITNFDETKTFKVDVALLDLFLSIADEALVPASEKAINSNMKPAVVLALPSEIAEELGRPRPPNEDKFDTILRRLRIKNRSVDDVLRQFMALGLVAPELVIQQSKDPYGRSSNTPNRYWVLTSKGKAQYLEKRARVSGTI